MKIFPVNEKINHDEESFYVQKSDDNQEILQKTKFVEK